MKRLSLLLLVFFLLTLALSVTVSAQAGETYYVNVRSAKVRSEATTKGSVVTTLKRGDAVSVLETVEGTRVSRSTVWYHVTAGSYEGYIHSSLVTNIAPAVTGNGSGGSNTGSGTGSNPAPISTPIPQVSSGESCPDISANCSALTCAQAYACLAAGHGGLDRDHDGVPCESVCPGG